MLIRNRILGLFVIWETVFTNAELLDEWLIEVPRGTVVANEIANDFGYDLIKEILWAEQQQALIRTKRDLYLIKPEAEFAGSLPSVQRISQTFDPETRPDFFNDPFWTKQWYLLDPIDKKRQQRQLDSAATVSLNVLAAWKAGYTGKNVVVTILDDGLETNHTDLKQNYDPEASLNINGNNRDPTPRYENPEDTHHGTRCAGEVAMQANNNVCGVGIAFNSRIGGIRMLDGTVSDRVEAEAFSFNNNHIDIYSSSWGPSDNGKTVEKPGFLAAKALEKGVTEGRGGKGAIYVWASGNGGINGDSCAYDGYASNIYTISVGSTTELGNVPIYSEKCPSTMAVTYSSGAWDEGKIISTDLLNSCTSSHTGTSASAPLAAGIFALVLEANPNLTWRDLKHLVVWTSDPFTLLHSPGWYVNGMGLLVHPNYGFGLMDAELLVRAATIWETVPEKNRCIVRKTGIEDQVFSYKRPLSVDVRTKACEGSASKVSFLEHVEVVITLSHLRRGAVRIFVTSPMGTKTLIAPLRATDASTNGFNEWPFLSVHTWGENPYGTWTVRIESHSNNTATLGSLHALKLIFHGTEREPVSTKLLREWRRDRTTQALIVHEVPKPTN